MDEEDVRVIDALEAAERDLQRVEHYGDELVVAVVQILRHAPRSVARSTALGGLMTAISEQGETRPASWRRSQLRLQAVSAIGVVDRNPPSE